MAAEQHAHPTALSERIVKKLRALGVQLPAKAEQYCYLRRTRAGYKQRSDGRWVWVLDTINEHECKLPFDIGSRWAANTVLAAKKLRLDKDPEQGRAITVLDSPYALDIKEEHD